MMLYRASPSPPCWTSPGLVPGFFLSENEKMENHLQKAASARNQQISDAEKIARLADTSLRPRTNFGPYTYNDAASIGIRSDVITIVTVLFNPFAGASSSVKVEAPLSRTSIRKIGNKKYYFASQDTPEVFTESAIDFVFNMPVQFSVAKDLPEGTAVNDIPTDAYQPDIVSDYFAYANKVNATEKNIRELVSAILSYKATYCAD